jgi:hypothetical protein
MLLQWTFGRAAIDHKFLLSVTIFGQQGILKA